ATRVIRRKTNHRHMIGDHHGQTLGEQLSWSEPWTRFSARTGTWSVALVPYEANVGSLTLTFANDVPTRALTPGTPVTTAIKFAGQQAGYTFAATAKKNVTFNVTHFSFTQSEGPREVFLVFYEPGSSRSYTTCDVGGSTYCNFTTPVGGTWSVALVPYEANVGSLTLTFANDVPTKALTPGTPGHHGDQVRGPASRIHLRRHGEEERHIQRDALQLHPARGSV
ncbi:MAG: hypothetical protein ABSB01_17930, partial [Streptosporangiaceae bacterium]